MIKIETEKVVVRGERVVSIKKISALGRDSLPVRYIEGFPCAYLRDGRELFIRNTDEEYDYHILWPGEEYDNEIFLDMLEMIRKAGNRLRSINIDLVEENAEWTGKEAYII